MVANSFDVVWIMEILIRWWLVVNLLMHGKGGKARKHLNRILFITK